MVNVMSHKEDHCFQCQESCHIACHCPSVWCFMCVEYGHIVMDCPYRIPPSGTPVCHHKPKPHSSHHSRLTSCHHHEDRHRCRSHPHRYHSKSHHNSYRGCSRSHHKENRWHHRSSSWHPHPTTYTHRSHCNTPHHISSMHRSSSAHSRDCSRLHSWPAYKPTKKTSHCSLSCSSRSQGKTHTKRNSRVTIDDIQMDYYSLDDHSSDSEEDSDHLN